MKSLVLLLTLAVAGCGATVKASSPRSVVIHAGGVASAQTLANTECAKHGRFARFVQERPEFVYTFDCVE
jgi:hypothetical protein